MNYNEQVEFLTEIQAKIRAIGKTKVMSPGQAKYLTEKFPPVLETIRRAEMQEKAFAEIYKCALRYRECLGCHAIALLVEEFQK